ncbi:MAG: hydrolase [Pedobacter sp.]|nr:MAG: hydrolase [Pedobacter sp.]
MQSENKSYEGIISNVSSELIERLKKIKHVALDMDGTIYNGSTLFPYTPGFLESLKNAGISYSFLTNNPSKGIGDYLQHLEKMGIPAVAEEMYTSPDAVVVGFDSTLIYSRLCRAAWWVSQQLPYMATNPDWVCPTDQPVILIDCGAICACIEGATKRLPDIVLGKPDPRMLDGILHRQGLQTEEIAMVGDRLYTDVKMALNANALGVLVLSGEATMDDVAASDVKADVIAENVAKFGELLLAVQQK